MLVSLNSRTREGINSVLILTVLEESGIDVETVVSLMVEKVTIEDVALDGSEWAGTVEGDSCAELVGPILLPAVFVEDCIVSVVAVACEVASNLSEMLLTLSGVLVTGSKLVLNIPVVFTRPEVRSEVVETGKEVLCPCNVKATGEGEVVGKMGSRADGDLDSSTEEGFVHDTSSEPLLISDCGNP